ncbi:MAG: hypothetical protein MPN21_27675 [Thermoanaerobaculia bacterium]|nr:hypothetical protein [Thermoanaerobaculia bacterium]
MSRDTFLLPPDARPNWVKYPPAFRRIVEQMLIDLRPWRILEGEQALLRFRGLAKRYPSRDLFPFACRQDNDDLACWASGMGEKVLIIHDFSSPGYEDESDFEDVWAWLRSAVEDMIEFEP